MGFLKKIKLGGFPPIGERMESMIEAKIVKPKKAPFKRRESYRSISLLGLSFLAWEYNELALVLLQPLDILLQGLHGSVTPTEVDRDADTSAAFLVETGSLKIATEIVHRLVYL